MHQLQYIFEFIVYHIAVYCKPHSDSTIKIRFVIYCSITSYVICPGKKKERKKKEAPFSDTWKSLIQHQVLQLLVEFIAIIHAIIAAKQIFYQGSVIDSLQSPFTISYVLNLNLVYSRREKQTLF